MCNALLGKRSSAYARRPSRDTCRADKVPLGGHARRGRGPADGTVLPAITAGAMTVIEIGRNIPSFIACAADPVLFVAMEAAAERAA